MLRVSRPSAPTSVTPYVVLLVLITASVSWRSKTYYEGSFDLVVIVKGVLSLLALGWAFRVARGRMRRPIDALFPALVILYLGGTVLGGWAAGSLLAASVVAVRVAILLATVVLLAMAFDSRALLTGLVAALVTVGVVASVTGLSTLDGGRLSGGIPPLHPNEIAMIACTCILWTLHRFATARSTAFDLLAFAAGVSVAIATGSRTALIVVVLGALIVLACATQYRITFLLPAMVVTPVALWLVGDKNGLQAMLIRGEASSDSLFTLSGRTIAWTAALDGESSAWSSWLGQGLAHKHIQVEGQAWSRQILDSSWLSALVQGGYIGLGLVVLIALVVMLRSLFSDREFRGFRFGLAVFLIGRASLESGLFDASAAFISLAVLAVIPRGRDDIKPGEQIDRLAGPLRNQPLDMTGHRIQMHSTLRWRAALTFVAIGLVAAGLLNYFSAREYEASASIYAQSATPQIRPSAVYQGTLTVAARMDTYVQLASSRLVTDKVRDQLAMDESASSLRSRVKIFNPTGTTIITVTVRDRDPARAQVVAAAVVDNYIETIDAIETSNQAPAQVQFQVVQPATARLSAVSPNEAFNIVVGGLAGGLVGMIVGLWPFIRIARSASDNLTIVMLGPLADRLSGDTFSSTVIRQSISRVADQPVLHQSKDGIQHV